MVRQTGIQKFDEYCEGVKSGAIPVCKWVRLAVDRHYRDLKESKKKSCPFYFEPKAVQHYFDYLSRFKHYEGAVNGQPFEAEPWQWFVYGSIFGWLQKKEHRVFPDIPIRRFRTAMIFVPKKNGKSFLSGVTGLYMMDGDGWPGAQCYILAKNQTHAKDLGYRAATITAQNDPVLAKECRVNRSAAGAGIYFDGNNSFYKPITSKPESEDGRNVHFCGPDETKDWTDFEIYEVMKNGTVNAPNSLFMSTTTAGHNQESLGYFQQKYLEQVLSDKVEDDTTFGVVYTVDEEDKLDKDGNIKEGWWLSPDVWKKANPNYNVSVYKDSLVALASEAKQSPSKRTAFETKHLNIWHTSNEAFVQEEKWQACGRRKFTDIKDYIGVPCWGGIDLGSVSDFTAFVLVTENGEIIPYFWIPADTVQDRKNSALVRGLVDSGYVETTPGDWTDHDFVEDRIKDIASIVDLREVVYDRYKMDQMITHLQEDGIEMTPFGQGYVSMNPAVDYLENAILKGEIEHFNNPVLEWMIGNVSIKKDPAGNRKFDKDKSQDKIDGVVALAMALFRSSVEEEKYPVFSGNLTTV